MRGQVAFAAGDVGQGIAHQGQAAQQATDADGQQHGGSHDADQGDEHFQLQQFAQGRLGIGLVHGNAQHPGRALDAGSVNELRGAAHVHFGVAPGLGQPCHERCRQRRGDGGGGFQHQLGIGVGQDAALAIEQEGKALVCGLDAIDSAGRDVKGGVGGGEGGGRGGLGDWLGEGEGRRGGGGGHVGAVTTALLAAAASLYQGRAVPT